MKVTPTKPLMIRAPRSLFTRLQSVAKANGMPVSQVVRIALEHGLPITESRLAAVRPQPSDN